MHEKLGDHLVGLALQTEISALLVAPFIKVGALKRVVDALEPGIPLTVVTRWVPEELAAGVSDLEVWEAVQGRQGAMLRLLPGLHAKYFRFDDAALVGSANLTQMALGWTKQPNLELLIELPAADFATFEELLARNSFEVDAAAHAAMQVAVNALAADPTSKPLDPAPEPASVQESWFPRSLQVQRLFDCYEGRRDEVIESVFKDGQLDLTSLAAPGGMNERTFDRFVAARLQQVPAVALIDAASATALDRTSGAHLLVGAGLVSEEEGIAAWDVISAWLLHFFPHRYRSKATFTGPALERSQVIR